MSRFAVLVFGCALLLSGCGDDSAAAIDELVAEGMPEDVAECVIEQVEGSEVSVSEVADGSPIGVAAVRLAFGPCLNDDALVELLEVENLDQVRAVLASTLSRTGTMTNEQAFCLIETVEAEGFSLVDVGGYSQGTDQGALVEASLESAQASCLAE